jgi:hypothetical protein
MNALDFWLNQNRHRLEMRDRIALEVIATRNPQALIAPHAPGLLSAEGLAAWRTGHADGVAALAAEAASIADAAKTAGCGA